MRTLFTLLAAGSALLLASPVHAQTSASAPAEGITQVQITAPAPHYNIRRDELRAVRGTYAMSNGWTLSVQPQPSTKTITAQIDDGAVIELLAVSPDRFETPDHSTSMVFNQGAQQDEMTMRYTLPDRTVMVLTTSQTLAGR